MNSHNARHKNGKFLVCHRCLGIDQQYFVSYLRQFPLGHFLARRFRQGPRGHLGMERYRKLTALHKLEIRRAK